MSTTEAGHRRPDITALRQAIRDEYDATAVAAGFIDFEITWSAEVFAGASQSSSVAAYGTLGINFWAKKPLNEQERDAYLVSQVCGLPSE